MTRTPLLSGQHLVLDADDTLWENNIYFEQAFEDFVTFLDYEHLTGGEIQEILDELEIANRGSHGYGARAFARSLRDTFVHISGLPESHPDADTVESLGLRILNQHVEIREGVIDTITALRPRHQLYVLTKGHEEEQQAKIERSGIRDLFDAVMISAEKNEGTYRSIIEKWELDPAATSMGRIRPARFQSRIASRTERRIHSPPTNLDLEVEEVTTLCADQGVLVQLSRSPN